MLELKCNCGSPNCTVKLELWSSSGSGEIRVSWKEGTSEKCQDFSLDPNSIVQLIKELKQILIETTN
jgi:hypothetical protein